MNNMQIIAKEAIAQGLFSEEDVAAYTSAGKPLPLHTFQTWAENGFIVQKGQKARLVTKIWKPTKKKNEENGQEEQNWVKTIAYFVTSDQVTPAT